MRTDTTRRLHPRIADAFGLYLSCRQLQFVHMEMKKDRGRKVEHKIVTFVSGFHTLPEPGGVLDQGQWLMEMFNVFRAGENAGTQKTIK